MLHIFTVCALRLLAALLSSPGSLAIAVPRTACLFRPSQTITLTYSNYTITDLCNIVLPEWDRHVGQVYSYISAVG
jgi:hypothetical protein